MPMHIQLRSALEESAGLQLMGWQLEVVAQAPSVGPGEEDGMAAHPGTAWPCLD